MTFCHRLEGGVESLATAGHYFELVLGEGEEGILIWMMMMMKTMIDYVERRLVTAAPPPPALERSNLLK